MNRNRFISIDILKGIAIIMILIVHNRHFVLTGELGLWNLVNFGEMGCQIFFVLSGFGLTAAWDRNSTNKLARNNSFFRYICGRYKRILPGFLLILIINIILNVILIDCFDYMPGYIVNRDLKGILLNVTLLHGLSPEYINSVFPGGWYIGTSMLLYFLFPVLEGIVHFLWERAKALAMLIPIAFLYLDYHIQKLVFVKTTGELFLGHNNFMYFFVINQLPVFVVGIVLYYFVRDGFDEMIPPIISGGVGIVVMIMAILMYLEAVGIKLGGLVTFYSLELEVARNFIFGIIPAMVGLSVSLLTIAMVCREKRSIAGAENTRNHLADFQGSGGKNHFPAFLGSGEKNQLSMFLASCGKNHLATFLASCGKNHLSTFLASCGKNSYGMYLVHGFFSWYGLKAITVYMMEKGIEYNDKLYYLVAFPVVLALTYLSGVGLEKLLKKILITA